MLAYNHESFLKEAIDGVLKQQTEYTFELIIGEDCSTDKTREIALAYQRRYPERIRVIISDKNVGMHENSLRVKESVKGRYIAFCEGDDYWTSPEKLQRQISWLENNADYALSFHNAFVRYDGLKGKPKKFNPNRPLNITVRDFIEKDWMVPTASLIVRRAVLPAFPAGFADFPSGDLATSILVGAAGKIHYLKECMSVYRKQPGGLSQRVTTSAEAGIHYWQRVNAMLSSLDVALGSRYHDSFERRILRNNRTMDYIRLKYDGRISLRILWNSVCYQLEDKKMRLAKYL